MMSGMIYLRTIAYYRYQRSYHGKILMPSNQHLGCSSSPFCSQEVLCSLPNLASSEPASTPPCYRAWHFILLPAQSQVGSLNWVCRAPYPPQRSSDMSPSQSVRVNSLPLKPLAGKHIILALLGLRNDADIEPFRQRILADSQPSRLSEYTSRIMSSSLRRCDIFVPELPTTYVHPHNTDSSSTNWAKNFGLSIAHQQCSATGH
ncbi:hypothetical protein BKA60DRAFT_2971 [Fusarium oxysporum]|nr:hypothetical protein BKA60DRAFT_2971 [Fusarium oxysporum]